MNEISVKINLLDSIFNSLGSNITDVYNNFIYYSLIANFILLIVGGVILLISAFLFKDKKMFELERSSDPIKLTIATVLVIVGFVIVICCFFDIFKIYTMPEIYFIRGLLEHN